MALADGSWWVYQYDPLGQVISGRRFWADGTPVAGQQFEYAFDDIGNRTSTGGRASSVPAGRATLPRALISRPSVRPNNRRIRSKGSPGGSPSQPCSHDADGNVMGLVAATDGTLSARYAYGPFGVPLRATGPMAETNPFRFSTKYRDAESGFYYYGYR